MWCQELGMGWATCKEVPYTLYHLSISLFGLSILFADKQASKVGICVFVWMEEQDLLHNVHGSAIWAHFLDSKVHQSYPFECPSQRVDFTQTTEFNTVHITFKMNPIRIADINHSEIKD